MLPLEFIPTSPPAEGAEAGAAAVTLPVAKEFVIVPPLLHPASSPTLGPLEAAVTLPPTIPRFSIPPPDPRNPTNPTVPCFVSSIDRSVTECSSPSKVPE